MTTSTATPEALQLRALVDARRDGLDKLLHRYNATRPRLFGSVARGDATVDSDIDILVDMDPADGNLLLRASGLLEETRELFGRDDVDIVPIQLLRTRASDQAVRDAVPL